MEQRADEGPDDVTVARRYFLGGFLMLPLLWLVNGWSFWAKSRKPNSDPALRMYVNGSLLGASVMFAGLAAWIVYFQLNWRDNESLQDLLVVTVSPDEW